MSLALYLSRVRSNEVLDGIRMRFAKIILSRGRQTDSKSRALLPRLLRFWADPKGVDLTKSLSNGATEETKKLLRIGRVAASRDASVQYGA
jgi:hypothetical protein